jgi:signal transduction histidine kinase
MTAALGLDRLNRSDIWVAVVVAAWGTFLMVLYAHGTVVDGERIDTSYLAVPAFLLVTAPLLLRSQAPLVALAVSIVGVGLHGALFGDLFRCGAVYLVAGFFAYSVALRLPRREAIVGLALSVVLCMLMAAVGDGATGVILQPGLFVVWGAGRFARSRSQLNETLEARTVALRDARDERARLEVAMDRQRLSSELDELLRRRLSDLARLAEAGGAESEPEAAIDTLVEIERESRRTLEQMREIVGTLRSENGDPAAAPPPTLAHLEALLLRAKGAGAHLRVAGNPRVLPAGVELSAYRVIEHLLDALADAPEVSVEVTFAEDALGLRVTGETGRGDLGPRSTEHVSASSCIAAR